MTILSTDRIRLQASAKDKTDAIRQSGDLLVRSGCVQPAYVEGMLAREETMSTYLGNGVSIPHGQYENRSQIIKTGIAVLQLADGVEWEDGEKAYLVIAIAAAEDEHVGVLANLAEAIEDEAVAKQLMTTSDPALILNTLEKEAATQ